MKGKNFNFQIPHYVHVHGRTKRERRRAQSRKFNSTRLSGSPAPLPHHPAIRPHRFSGSRLIFQRRSLCLRHLGENKPAEQLGRRFFPRPLARYFYRGCRGKNTVLGVVINFTPRRCGIAEGGILIPRRAFFLVSRDSARLSLKFD